MKEEDDWFASAAAEAANTPAAKQAEARRKVAERLRADREAQIARMEAASRRPKGEVAAAAAIFAAVAAGIKPSYQPSSTSATIDPSSNRASSGGGSRAQLVSPEAALKAIVKHVRESDDPFTAAGEWISRVTNELSAIAREHAEE